MVWGPPVLISACALLWAASQTQAVRDPDTFWHIRAGEYVWDRHVFAGPEPWSSFSSRTWVLHEWLPELAYAGLARLGGLSAISAVESVGAIAVLAALYVSCRRLSAPLPSAITAILGWLGTSAGLTARPQVISFVLLAAVTTAWILTARDLRARWWLVPLTWLWACSHGLWLAGPIAGAAVVFGMALDRTVPARQLLKLAAIPVASVAVAAVTPVGPRLLLAPLEVRGYARYVAEWAPTSFFAPFALAAATLLAIVVVASARSRERLPYAHLALTAVGAAWILSYGRTVALGAVMLAPLAAAAFRTQSTTRSRKQESSILIAGCALAVAASLLVAWHAPQTPPGVPTGLNRQLAALPRGTVVYNEYALGGWILWRHRQLEPVIDGRTEVYALAYVDDYMSASLAQEGWDHSVADSGARVALLPRGSALATALTQRAGWREVGRDQGWVLLER
jgi:hypothetical protein